MFDVIVSRDFKARPEDVASVMFDPMRDPEWIGGAKKATILTDGPYGVGTRVRREGAFLGRKIGWVTETTAFEPGKRAAMRIIDGPFKGDVEYRIDSTSKGARVSLANRGVMPGMLDFLSATMVRMSTEADLKRLAMIVEARS